LERTPLGPTPGGSALAIENTRPNVELQPEITLTVVRQAVKPAAFGRADLVCHASMMERPSMLRAHKKLLLVLIGAVALGCASRTPAPTTAPDATDSMLARHARILRAEDRRVVDDDLMQLFGDPEPRIRRLAVRAAGRIGDRSTVGRVARAMDDEDPGVRAQAAVSLAWLGATDETAAIRSHVEDPSPEVRAAVAVALGRLHAESAETSIVRLLEDEVPSVVAETCYALAAHDDPGFAVDPLIELSKRVDVPEVAFACTWALAEISADASRLDRGTRLRARNRMIELTQSPIAVVRRLAARGLTVPTREEEAASVGPLIEDPDPMVRIATVRALSFPGAPVDPFLGQALADEDQDPRVYLALVDGLGRMRGPEIIEILARIVVHDARPWIRERAVVALGRASNLSAQMANGLSRADDYRIRRATGQLLVGRIDEETIEFAMRLYADQDPRVRAAVIPALADADGPLTEILADAIEGDDPRLHAAAARAAGRRLARGDDAQQPSEPTGDSVALLRRLLDASDDVAHAATALEVMRAAGQAAPRTELRALLERGLRHPSWKVRLEASRQLERVYDVDASGEIEPAADHPLEHYLEIARWAQQPRGAVVTVQRPGFLPGRFTLRLDLDNAPLTSWSFARLAEEGYYDDLPMDRLIPDVALYTGDRLDESAAPPEVDLRDEIGTSRFLPGTVGMLSPGPDMASGAFFVTLLPRPELFGAYTAFGQVVQNLPGVVALTLPYDRVVSVRVYAGDGSEPLPPLEQE
jgi:HEAT repeat protein/cyclophilin family peptidyl-prolyl cis-trans isomerase